MRTASLPGTLKDVNDRKERTMARTKLRRIGPIGTLSRGLAGLALLYLAVSDGGRLTWDLRWHEVALGLGVLPAVMLGIGLAARSFAGRPVRFTGPLAIAVNAALGVALFATEYTAGGAGLFVGTTLLVAAWRAQPGCELTVLSNSILRRDDQIGCFVFTPIDVAEARLTARASRSRARAQADAA
jgi:hypothetical protein